MDETIKRRLATEWKKLAAGSVFSVQDFSVALSKLFICLSGSGGGQSGCT